MNSRKKFIVGNWKMNPENIVEADKLFKKIEKEIEKNGQNNSAGTKKVIPVICPPFVFLGSLGRKSLGPNQKGNSKVKSGRLFLGAQDVSYSSEGAHTGEISPNMLMALGVRYCIIGHSERRAMGETSEITNRKLLACIKVGITPILCVGEKARDDNGDYLVEVKEQVLKGLVGVDRAMLDSVIIAYEPIFAVGAARALEAHGVHEMILYIKKLLIDTYKLKNIETAVLYGGAVDTTNAAELLGKGNADGFLIGRQSLEPENFLAIFEIAKASR